MPDDRLSHIEQQLETLIRAMGVLGGIVQVTNAMIGDLIKKMDEPPSNDLPDLIKQLVAAVDDVREDLRVLPEKVARAVDSGEVP